MKKIIPIRDLAKTAEISQMCREATEPIYITKNGYGDMVIMNVEIYEKKLAILEIYEKLADSEEQVAQGMVYDAREVMKELREKYHV